MKPFITPAVLLLLAAIGGSHAYQVESWLGFGVASMAGALALLEIEQLRIDRSQARERAEGGEG